MESEKQCNVRKSSSKGEPRWSRACKVEHGRVGCNYCGPCGEPGTRICHKQQARSGMHASRLFALRSDRFWVSRQIWFGVQTLCGDKPCCPTGAICKDDEHCNIHPAVK